MHKLDHYVGRIVRLKDRAYEQIVRRGRRFVEHQENCFLVAAVDRQLSRLICYGANQRIDVGPGDIVLV
ncbi:hypothetical protein [Propionivibrio sp.]|jgi:hypothetical protein|uniref:hypothetical protein n=1 Tax=Propionivibrio sp. TaxID=2212460 RepID=UPI00272ED9F6|nr:hypothetical protein [Propionivibrio sp.]